MWIAQNWNDYEVLDTSSGEKLERWGDYLLVRPDPQVIWNTPKTNGGWKKSNGHYHRSSKGGGEWEFHALPEEWQISYEPLSLSFRLKPFRFKHTGLFPEQAVNWDWFSALIKAAGRPVKVLNLFAYTGGATLAAARAVCIRLTGQASDDVRRDISFLRPARSGTRVGAVRELVIRFHRILRRPAGGGREPGAEAEKRSFRNKRTPQEPRLRIPLAVPERYFQFLFFHF